MTTSGAANGENFVKITTLTFHYIPERLGDDNVDDIGDDNSDCGDDEM